MPLQMLMRCFVLVLPSERVAVAGGPLPLPATQGPESLSFNCSSAACQQCSWKPGTCTAHRRPWHRAVSICGSRNQVTGVGADSISSPIPISSCRNEAVREAAPDLLEHSLARTRDLAEAYVGGAGREGTEQHRHRPSAFGDVKGFCSRRNNSIGGAVPNS